MKNKIKAFYSVSDKIEQCCNVFSINFSLNIVYSKIVYTIKLSKLSTSSCHCNGKLMGGVCVKLLYKCMHSLIISTCLVHKKYIYMFIVNVI